MFSTNQHWTCVYKGRMGGNQCKHYQKCSLLPTLTQKYFEKRCWKQACQGIYQRRYDTVPSSLVVLDYRMLSLCKACNVLEAIWLTICGRRHLQVHCCSASRLRNCKQKQALFLPIFWDSILVKIFHYTALDLRLSLFHIWSWCETTNILYPTFTLLWRRNRSNNGTICMIYIWYIYTTSSWSMQNEKLRNFSWAI